VVEPLPDAAPVPAGEDLLGEHAANSSIAADVRAAPIRNCRRVTGLDDSTIVRTPCQNPDPKTCKGSNTVVLRVVNERRWSFAGKVQVVFASESTPAGYGDYALRTM
jgi:hypothetical protein